MFKHDLAKGEVYPSAGNGREVPTEQFFRKRTSPRVSCVQTRSRQGGSLSFRGKRKSRSDRTVFSKTDVTKGWLCPNTIKPRGKSVLPQKTEEQVRQNCFFRKRTSPRMSCVQTRSRQGGSLSFRGKRRSGSGRTVFSKTDFTKGELRSNTIPPRDKSVKTDHRQGGSAPSRRIKCNTGIRFRNRIDKTSSCHRRERRLFVFQ